MKSLGQLLKISALVATVTAAAATAVAQTQTEVQRHVDAATRLAAGDPLLLDNYKTYYCLFAEDRLDLRDAARADTARVPLTQVLDDVWYIGSRYVGQFIFRSPTGFMVVDSLNNTTEAQTYTTPALQSLGLGPTLPLTGVYLTHGHGDHDGGANYLRQVYGPTILLGSADATNKAYGPTLVDSANLQPQPFQLGGRMATMLSTPGHTNGSVSAVIPAVAGGRSINVVVVGGSSMPGTISGARNYLQSVERTYALATQMKPEASLHPHPVFDGTLRNLEKIAAAGGLTQPSPFVVGEEKILRGLAIYRECSAAWVAKVDATAVMPVWRATSIEFQGNSPSPNEMAVKLTVDGVPLPYQELYFTLNDGEATCVASTDQNGVATCGSRMGALRPYKDRMTVTFGGSQTPTTVELASKASAPIRPNGVGRPAGR